MLPLLFLIFVSVNKVKAQIQLTSIPNDLSGEKCPENVILTCTAVNINSAALIWFFDDIDVASYPYTSMDDYPQVVPLQRSVNNVTITVLEASHNSNTNLLSFTSTLTYTLTALLDPNVRSITCGSFGTRSEAININYIITACSPTTTLPITLPATTSPGLVTTNSPPPSGVSADPVPIIVGVVIGVIGFLSLILLITIVLVIFVKRNALQNSSGSIERSKDEPEYVNNTMGVSQATPSMLGQENNNAVYEEITGTSTPIGVQENVAYHTRLH